MDKWAAYQAVVCDGRQDEKHDLQMSSKVQTQCAWWLLFTAARDWHLKCDSLCLINLSSY